MTNHATVVAFRIYSAMRQEVEMKCKKKGIPFIHTLLEVYKEDYDIIFNDSTALKKEYEVNSQNRIIEINLDYMINNKKIYNTLKECFYEAVHTQECSEEYNEIQKSLSYFGDKVAECN